MEASSADEASALDGLVRSEELERRATQVRRSRTIAAAESSGASIRADGTIVLAVGERPPDLGIDELRCRARARPAALTPSSG